MEKGIKSDKKLTRNDFELIPDPVWVNDGNKLRPSDFFLKWWKQVAQQQFGDSERWLDVAVDLGYVSRYHNQLTGELCIDPTGFDYDPVLFRTSLGIPLDMPLIRANATINNDSYQRLWELLFHERRI